jgi:hypothetical protein
MKKVSKVISLVIFGSALLIAQSTSQPSGPAAKGTQAQTPKTTVNPSAQSHLIHILTPVSGQASTSDAVTLKFEVTNPGAGSGEPNFQLQLDGQDPITTSETSYTYTGLAPGNHTITVVLVDANGTPVPGSTSTVQFTVKNPAPGPGTSSSNDASPSPINLDEATRAHSSIAANNLPIISLIGFGVLIGGVASAMKTRE